MNIHEGTGKDQRKFLDDLEKIKNYLGCKSASETVRKMMQIVSGKIKDKSEGRVDRIELSGLMVTLGDDTYAIEQIRDVIKAWKIKNWRMYEDIAELYKDCEHDFFVYEGRTICRECGKLENKMEDGKID
jgi:hypothetical protein